MNRIILASLLIIVILSAGCTVDKTSELAPATPGSLQPVSIHQTIVPVTPSITDSITGNVTNGTGVGNKSLSSQTGDLFLIAPMNSRFYEGDVITINGTTI